MQKLIVVDEKGNKIGEETIEKCHSGNGIKHLAFVIFLVNSKGEILIQKRSKNKRFANYWEIPASHLYVKEKWEEALRRTLKKELGIIKKLRFKKLFAFSYFIKENEDVENEYCVVFACKYDGEIKPNYEEISEYKFEKYDKISELINKEKVAKWLIIPYEILKKRKFILF